MEDRLQELRRKFEALEQASKAGGKLVSQERVTELERELAGLRTRRAALAATLGRITMAMRHSREVIIDEEKDPERPHTCPKCDKTYKDKSSLVRHLGTVHKR
jgi:predicted  nucleic acid-binding Zn-ribbon protein